MLFKVIEMERVQSDLYQQYLHCFCLCLIIEELSNQQIWDQMTNNLQVPR